MKLIIVTIFLLLSVANAQGEKQMYDTMLRIESKIDSLSDRLNSANSRLASLEMWKEQSDKFYGDAFSNLKEQSRINSQDIASLKEVVANMKGMAYTIMFIGGLMSFFINLALNLYSNRTIRRSVAQELRGSRRGKN